MSRLDSFIRRLEAQRRCLDMAAVLAQPVPGPVFELGLGNGRTYDHLRELCPGREIFVFEREVAAHPDCIPAPAHLFEGPLESTLPKAARRFGPCIALLHADLGSGRPSVDRQTSAFLSGQLPALLAPGGIVLSDQPLSGDLVCVPLPGEIQPGRYFLYRSLQASSTITGT